MSRQRAAKGDVDEEEKEDDALYQFTPKDWYSCKDNLMAGICLPAWVCILHRHRGDIAWTTVWPRLLFLTCISVWNSLWACVETALFGRAVGKVVLNERPVFIIGHPRTGTTLLHNLLSRDRTNFTFASTFDVGFPSTFLLFGKLGFKFLLSPLISETRPMDAMKLDFDLPQEDELATNVLSAGTSPIMPLLFMKRAQARVYLGYNAFEGEEKAFRRWHRAFLGFLRKLTYRVGSRKRLLLKSPNHCGRVRLLLQLFPNAQFVYVHRDPLVTFQSACHMADAYYWKTYLQKNPTNDDIQSFILEQGKILYEAYLRDRGLIPEGNLVEVSFAELEADQISVCENIYTTLKLGDFHRDAEACVRDYVKDLEGFKKNALAPLSPALQALVRTEWGAQFRAFDYD